VRRLPISDPRLPKFEKHWSAIYVSLSGIVDSMRHARVYEWPVSVTWRKLKTASDGDKSGRRRCKIGLFSDGGERRANA
jgi:hypothetical protein